MQPGAPGVTATAGPVHSGVPVGVAGPRGPQQAQPRPAAFPYNRPGPARPQGMPQPGQVVSQPVPQQAVLVPGQVPLTAAMLAAAKPNEREQMLGERLYPIIHQYYGELAGKITGMLLEIDNAELLHMLEVRDSLKAKVSHIFLMPL